MAKSTPPKPKRVRHATKLARITLAQVAAAAGLPLMTVSRAIRGKTKEVNERDFKLAVETARRLGYRPNLMNRALRTGRRQLVGIVVPPLDGYLHDLVTGIHDGCIAEEVLCCLRPLPQNADREACIAALHALSDRQVDGIIAILPNHLEALAWELPDLCHQRSLPLVQVGVSDRQIPGAVVGIDLESGLQQVFARLADAGVGRVVVVDAPALFPRLGKWIPSLTVLGGAAGLQVEVHEVLDGLPGRNTCADWFGQDGASAVVTLVPWFAAPLAAIGATIPKARPVTVVAVDGDLAIDGWPLVQVAPDPRGCGREAARLLLDQAYRGESPRRIRQSPQVRWPAED